MFTGIVEEIGTIKEANAHHLLIEAKKVLREMIISDSIAVSGSCLTVTTLDNNTFSVDIMPETLRHTNLGELRYGNQVNLERALPIGGRIGGHLVLGHVDDTGEIAEITFEEASHTIKISAPSRLMPYIANKGFIAVDGISLTITSLDDSSFTVSLIPYTLKNTTIANRRRGDKVNLEVDVIARYIEQLNKRNSQNLSFEFLKEYGFTREEN